MARRGTKSCIECRRRKVRCIRSPEDAPACRRCEERGSECTLQTLISQPYHVQKPSSRHRISQLESEVASLSHAVRDIRSKLGYQPRQSPESTFARPESSFETDESDNHSSISDVLVAEPPSHLCSLFQNDWLSLEVHRQKEQLQDRRTKSSTHALDIAREALQKLIPSREAILKITNSPSTWLVLLHALLPQPFTAKSMKELLESYEEMHASDVDPIGLASWLLTIAITAQQVQREDGSPATQLEDYQWCRWRFNFCRAVYNAVDSTIIRHDALICTTQGLGMAIHFFRLQISQGNFQKAWLRLRHFIAIAELMGLPETCQAIQLSGDNEAGHDETQLQRAQLWELIVSTEGLTRMIVNLPPCINPDRLPKNQALSIDDVVEPGAYLRRLMDIAAKIQYGHSIGVAQSSNAELYISALELDRQLKLLASQSPRVWWVRNVERVTPDHIVQFLHHCVNMRVHLSFATRQDQDQQFIYSRQTCRDACESVAALYQFLRRELPSGIFMSQAVDVQAFTATVFLLLTSYTSPTTDNSKSRINKGHIDGVVARIITLMNEKSRDTPGSNFAHYGANTLQSLNKLLQQDDQASDKRDLTLKIPLLGKIHIRRNNYMGTANANNLPSFQPPSTLPLQMPNVQFASQESTHLPLNCDNVSSGFLQQGEWQPDPFTWSIEEQSEDFLHDTLMAEEIDQFAIWPNNDIGFQFHDR